MNASTLTQATRVRVLRFAASFLWADLNVTSEERGFLAQLARELELDASPAELHTLLFLPPPAEAVDPSLVEPEAADAIRQAVLRAIAADGRVATAEMALFDLLDDLLPKAAHSP